MAGGALGGVFGAACRLFKGYSEDWIRTPFYGNEVVSQLISAALFVGLCVYLWFGSMRHQGGLNMSAQYEELIGNAILGIDTIWGGDVMCASGTGRFIADSWFSGQPLPRAYTVPEAAAVREAAASPPSRRTRPPSTPTLRKVDIPGAIAGMKTAAGRLRRPARRVSCRARALLRSHVGSGDGNPRQRRRRSLRALRDGLLRPGARAFRSRSQARTRCRTARRPGRQTATPCWLPSMRWRKQQRVSMASVRLLGAAVIGHFDALTARNILPYLPAELHDVPRANIEFLPITEAWFSGSMNYLGHARRPGGEPEYEASYEINASLEISLPEFLQLVSHEVVPGHVTTFAYLQNLYWRKLVGFEASVLTMNTRAAALFEGIANNAILMAYGVTEVEELPDHRPADRRAARPAAGRRQESIVVSDLGRRPAASRSRRNAAPRFPGIAGARRQALRRLGTPPATGPHVPARLPRRHEEGGVLTSQAQARRFPPGAIRSLRACRYHDDRQNVGLAGPSVCVHPPTADNHQ